MLASNEPAAGDASTRLDEQWLGLTASEQRGADVRMVRFQKSGTLSWPSQTCLHALADGAARLFRLQRLPFDLGPRFSPPLRGYPLVDLDVTGRQKKLRIGLSCKGTGCNNLLHAWQALGLASRNNSCRILALQHTLAVVASSTGWPAALSNDAVQRPWGSALRAGVVPAVIQSKAIRSEVRLLPCWL